MTGPSTAVITIARGRHEHLAGQAWGLARQSRTPDVEVVVDMADPCVADLARALRPGVLTASVDLVHDQLPLAAARNLGARTALAAGADQLVFLDVDCIPGDDLVRRYAEVLVRSTERESPPVVACGEVAYLPPASDPLEDRVAELPSRARPHPARPRPAVDEMVVADDVRLFWSLSFAIAAPHWDALGGFSEDFVGYGGEDTDFGQRLAAAGGTLLWVGGAPAYHQWHDSPNPPTQHASSIVRNANTFFERWGWFPMEGWLAAFAERGLAQLDPESGRWQLVAQEPLRATVGGHPTGHPVTEHPAVTPVRPTTGIRSTRRTR